MSAFEFDKVVNTTINVLEYGMIGSGWIFRTLETPRNFTVSLINDYLISPASWGSLQSYLVFPFVSLLLSYGVWKTKFSVAMLSFFTALLYSLVSFKSSSLFYILFSLMICMNIFRISSLIFNVERSSLVSGMVASAVEEIHTASLMNCVAFFVKWIVYYIVYYGYEKLDGFLFIFQDSQYPFQFISVDTRDNIVGNAKKLALVDLEKNLPALEKIYPSLKDAAKTLMISLAILFSSAFIFDRYPQSDVAAVQTKSFFSRATFYEYISLVSLTVICLRLRNAIWADVGIYTYWYSIGYLFDKIIGYVVGLLYSIKYLGTILKFYYQQESLANLFSGMFIGRLVRDLKSTTKLDDVLIDMISPFALTSGKLVDALMKMDRANKVEGIKNIFLEIREFVKYAGSYTVGVLIGKEHTYNGYSLVLIWALYSLGYPLYYVMTWIMTYLASISWSSLSKLPPYVKTLSRRPLKKIKRS